MKHSNFVFFALLSSLSLYSQPCILFPQNGQVLDNNQVQIRWKDTASVFDLQWGTHPLLIGAATISSINFRHYTLPTLPYNIRYYFRVRRVGGNWTPIYNFFPLELSSLSSLQHWWDAGWGLTLSGNKITNWQDRIGLVNAEGTTNPVRPEIIDTFPCGLSLLRFGGISGSNDHFLVLNPFVTLNTNNFTIVTNYRLLSFGLLDYLLGGIQSGLFVGGTLGGFNNIGLFNNPSVSNVNQPPTFTPWAVYSAYRNRFFRNNASLPVAGTPVSGFQVRQIGTRADASALSVHSTIGDIMIFSTELNDSIRLLVEDYQKWKWLQYPNLGNDTNLCATQFTLSVPTPNVYSSILWSTGETSVPSITITQSGTYWVRVTGMGVTLTDTIRINGIQSAKTITPNSDTTICLGQPFVIKVLNPEPTHQYIWNTSQVQDSILVSQPGTYYCVEFIPSLNCHVPTDTVQVFNNVNAGFAFHATCEGDTTTFVDNSFTYSGYVNSWNWDFGDPSTQADTAISFFASYAYPQSGSYLVQLAVLDTNGCADTTTQVVNILPNPVAGFSVNKECQNDPIQFTNLSTVQLPFSMSGYRWYFGTASNDSSSLINPKFTYTQQGNYLVTLIATSSNGCKHSVTDTLQINKFVDAAFTLPEDTLCRNESYTLVDNSNYFNTQPAQWLWSIGGANAGIQNPQTVTFNQPGLRQVRLIVTSADNCVDSMKTNIFIKNPPVASFTATPQVSAPPLVSVMNYTGTPDATNFLWNFGDSNTGTGSTVIHTYSDVGLYTVTLIASDANGCSDIATRIINVVVPVFDVRLNELICTETNGYIQFNAEIQNLSTITITGMELIAWIQGAEPVLENWQGQLFIGNTINYFSPYSLQMPEGAMYCCLRIGEVTGVISDSVFNKTLCVPLKNHFAVFTPFPNPSSGAFQMHLITPITDEAVVVISDLQGKNLYEQAIHLSNGLHTLSFDATFLSSGVYTVAVYYRGQRQVVMLLKN